MISEKTMLKSTIQYSDDKTKRYVLSVEWDKDKKKSCIYTHKEIKKLRFNTYYKDMAKLGELWAKAGFKVELYYKAPKQAKRGK